MNEKHPFDSFEKGFFDAPLEPKLHLSNSAFSDFTAKYLSLYAFTNYFRAEIHRFILWLPIFFAIGAAIAGAENFSLEINHLILFFILSFILAIITQILARVKDKYILHLLALFSFGILAISGGMLSLCARAKTIATPKIENIIHSKIKGEIIALDRGFSGDFRAKILVHKIDSFGANPLPKYLRISFKAINYDNIGNIVICNAFIAPPPPPILPDAYNFARKAYFMQIGGVGRCQSEISFLPQNQAFSFQKYIAKSRAKIANELANGKIGGGRGFLAAIITGDRSYISKSETEALQISGLSHIISVSGLHVALLSGLVFFAFHKILAFFPFIALQFDIKKIAAIIAFFAAAFYAFFSGAEAPALRSMIMVGVASFGILLNRRAISMRGLAIAAMILLILNPENAFDAGFQMSFLATMALVALWEYWQLKGEFRPRNWFETVIFWILGAIATSFVAGLATIPISLFNFQSVNSYGLIANLLAAPISDFIIAPFAIIGILFRGNFIGDFGLFIASWGLQKLLDIGFYFSQLPNANPKFADFSLLMMVLSILGFCMLCIFISKIRVIGILILAMVFMLWQNAPKSELLIAANGGAMLYVPNQKGKSAKLCFSQGNSFDAKRLLERAAIPANQESLLKSKITGIYSMPCNIYGGDWEAHFIKQAKAAKQESIISLTIRGKTYVINNQSAPIGAILYRKNDAINLKAPIPQSPWLTPQAALITAIK